MEPLQQTEKFGSGDLTTIESAAAVDCPRCGELVFTKFIGQTSCESCGCDFQADDHRGESCPGIECDDCGTAIPFNTDNRLDYVGFLVYQCSSCQSYLTVETDEGREPFNEVMKTDWILNGRSLEDVGTEFGRGRWIASVEASREAFITKLLNFEAKEAHSSFNLYDPEYTDAYLCFTEEYCVGYITWNWDSKNPELGQLFILPAFRDQGIGSGFVQAWRNDVVGPGETFGVNNPNSDMLRLLRRIGAVELTEDEIEFVECEITGHSFQIPDEWSTSQVP